MVVRGGVCDGLYQLTESTLDKAFVTGEGPSDNALEATKEGRKMDTFRRIYERLGYPGTYRLKDLYLFVEGVEVTIPPPHFQCNVYN